MAECRCIKCGNVFEGREGMPCTEIICPNCGEQMKKEE